jgi:hypothetical protein
VAGPDHPDHQGGRGAVNLTVARNVRIASASLARVRIPMDRGQRSERSRTMWRMGLKWPPLKSLQIFIDHRREIGANLESQLAGGGGPLTVGRGQIDRRWICVAHIVR